VHANNFITNRCTEWTGLARRRPKVRSPFLVGGLHKYRGWDLRIGVARELAMNREHVPWRTIPGDYLKAIGFKLR
jgi:hypothetical protein